MSRVESRLPRHETFQCVIDMTHTEISRVESRLELSHVSRHETFQCVSSIQ